MIPSVLCHSCHNHVSVEQTGLSTGKDVSALLDYVVSGNKGNFCEIAAATLYYPVNLQAIYGHFYSGGGVGKQLDVSFPVCHLADGSYDTIVAQDELPYSETIAFSAVDNEPALLLGEGNPNDIGGDQLCALQGQPEAHLRDLFKLSVLHVQES